MTGGFEGAALFPVSQSIYVALLNSETLSVWWPVFSS